MGINGESQVPESDAVYQASNDDNNNNNPQPFAFTFSSAIAHADGNKSWINDHGKNIRYGVGVVGAKRPEEFS